jgi:hypothetical protein
VLSMVTRLGCYSLNVSLLKWPPNERAACTELEFRVVCSVSCACDRGKGEEGKVSRRGGFV